MRKQLIRLGICIGLGGIGLGIAGGCGSANTANAAPANKLAPPGVTAVPIDSFKRQWTAKLDLRNDTPTGIYPRDEAVYVYTRSNTVYALKRDSGEILYFDRVAPRNVRLYPPVMARDRVVFATDSTLEIYDARGRRAQTIDVHRPLRSGVTATDKQGRFLFVGTDHQGGQGRLLRIDLNEPLSPIKWELMTPTEIVSTPVYYDRVLYAATTDGQTVATTDARDPVWPMEDYTFRTQGAVKGDLQVDDFGVYLACTDSKLYCLDRAKGQIKWQYYAGTPLYDGPVVSATAVYQLVPKVGLVAIEKTEGQYNRALKWTLPEGRQVLAEDDKYVYVLRADRVILAVDKQTGKVKFTSHRTPYRTFSTTVSSKGGEAIIYAANAAEAVAITPVLSGGSVGELVLRTRPLAEPLAVAIR